jgi:asparaginyl-tRNA synthetase
MGGFRKIEEAFGQQKGLFVTRGWVKRRRLLKEKTFLLLRDETGELQCVIDAARAPKELVEQAEQATIESSVEVEGKLYPDKRAPGGYELRVTKLKVIHSAKEFPIQRDFSTEFLLEVRHLWVRSARMRDALKVRATVFEGFHQFMKEHGFVEVQGPMFVSGAVEGGSTLFEVPYFGKKVYLTQSSQFYLEALIFSLGNVYTVAPSFRAEKSRTSRHLTEFWHAEAEMPWVGLKEIIDLEEAMLKFIIAKTVEERSRELKALGRDPAELEPSISKKYKRMRYEEAVKLAKRKFPHFEYGQDLTEKEEREIVRDFDVPVIVTHYPSALKPFYHRPDPKDNTVVLCNDILAPEGYGEVIGSGERCWHEEELIARMKEEGIDPAPYKWYLDLRRYGSVPHAGFGLGLDRLTAWICKAPHIRDVVPFPRTIRRYYP